MRARVLALVWVAITTVGCGGPAPKLTPVTPVTPPSDDPAPEPIQLTQLADPGEVLLGREKTIWLLEGRLLADADTALRAADATAQLGSPATRAVQVAEPKVRAYLRAHRSAETLALAREVVAALSKPSRQLLDDAGQAAGLGAEDIFLDYLTYEGLYDLATMRYGWRRLQAGEFAAGTPARALADSFFAQAKSIPDLARGISVVSSDAKHLELSVFGATVRADVTRARVESTAAVGRIGVVEWSSTYEAMRSTARGGSVPEVLEEKLDQDGGTYLLSYAVEVDEYLAWGAQQPWATLLSLVSVDEAADLYAGVVARGGLEAGGASPDPQTLPTRAAIPGGLTATVLDTRTADVIAGNKARRGHFLIATVELTAKAAEAQRATAAWFELAAGTARYPEVAVTHPGWGPAILATGPAGARLLALPFTAIPAKGKVKLSLVFDVPADVKRAALMIGAEQVAVKVEAK